MGTVTITAPSRSLQQRLDALEKGNGVRSARKELKIEIRARRQSVLDLLLAPPADILTMKVADLLIVIPKVGRVKVNKILGQCRISPSKTIGGMSERQRVEIASLLRRRA